jgi:UPF0716 protein FxsA
VFLGYLVLELGAFLALAYGVGIGWTLLIVLAVWALGVRLARAQGRRALGAVRAVGRGERAPDRVLADGALVAVGTLLVVIPGLVTSVLGALLLMPPTRFLVRPLTVLLASRRLGVLSTATTVFARGGGGPGAGEVIDGEVVETHYDDIPRLRG